MEERKDTNNPNKQKGETGVSPLSLHNLYSHVKISVKTLDKIIVGLIIALIVTVVIALSNKGFTVEFDSRGGTAVAIQKHLHGEKIDYSVPEREGYEFTGWALDEACSILWDPEEEITGSIKLYACWNNR